MKLELKNLLLTVDFEKRSITSLVLGGRERINALLPLFRMRLRDVDAKEYLLSAYDAKKCELACDGAIYSDFPIVGVAVRVSVSDKNGEAEWHVSVDPGSDKFFVEWVDFPLVNLPALEKNNTKGDGGKILYPYNEGVLVSDIDLRDKLVFPHMYPEYPSRGIYPVFPNMVCSQMLSYLWEDVGLYIGAHDEKRGVKGIEFVKEEDGVSIIFRLFCGTEFGKPYENAYPLVFAAIDGKWESAAERYRVWFEENLPPRVKKVAENADIPEWYADSPLVVSYPVRGVHDMDEMKPNKLHPYTNALPLLDDIREACDSRLLVLLMHWEGTAPWAPPYVWPPFGGEENFKEFLDALHAKGDMLGVYCSGFGYTMQSNLIADYNKEEDYKKGELWRGMCVSPEGKVEISAICPAQRSGYDVCPASKVGRSILKEAYTPLFESGVDYAQILDQNHGGGQYFCYSRDHGHPPAPGEWMTTSMQDMLGDWNDSAKNMLFGCESSAAEPFIGNLAFSDNRYEVNYRVGISVPLYAYIYHEYLRNFMGNQVACPFDTHTDTLRYRLAYSFAAGDCMTLVLTPDGELMANWGMRDFSVLPDKEKTFRFVANLSRFYKEQAKPYLYAGRMTASPEICCGTTTYDIRVEGYECTADLPCVLCSAWEAEDGKRALILVNPEETDAQCTVDGEKVTVPAMNAILLKK